MFGYAVALHDFLAPVPISCGPRFMQGLSASIV